MKYTMKQKYVGNVSFVHPTAVDGPVRPSTATGAERNADLGRGPPRPKREGEGFGTNQLRSSVK